MARWKWRDLNEKQKALVVGNITFSPTNEQPYSSHAPLATKKVARFNRQVSIVIRNRRSRLADYDGLWGKYVLDSLVDAGILQDDRPEIVQGITHTQEKISKGKQEETIIEIYEGE